MVANLIVHGDADSLSLPGTPLDDIQGADRNQIDCLEPILSCFLGMARRRAGDWATLKSLRPARGSTPRPRRADYGRHLMRVRGDDILVVLWILMKRSNTNAPNNAERHECPQRINIAQASATKGCAQRCTTTRIPNVNQTRSVPMLSFSSNASSEQELGSQTQPPHGVAGAVILSKEPDRPVYGESDLLVRQIAAAMVVGQLDAIISDFFSSRRILRLERAAQRLSKRGEEGGESGRLRRLNKVA